MALSEDQILRYSRQILLAPVGGVGQERLLASAARLTGQGNAQDAAALYLAAGGTPVAPCAPGGEAGLRAERPEAILGRGPETVGCVGGVPAQFEGEGPWVALGRRGERGALVYRSREGCAACFGATVAGLSRGDGGAAGLLLGALGALCYQRMVLGRSEPLGGLTVDEVGRVERLAIEPCEAHA